MTMTMINASDNKEMMQRTVLLAPLAWRTHLVLKPDIN